MRASPVVEAVIAAAVCFFVVPRCDRRAERRRTEENPPPSAEATPDADMIPDNVRFVPLDDFTTVNPVSGRKQTSVVASTIQNTASS